MPHITILLASYNGAAHIREQLDSFTQQTHADWSLRVADDGSSDLTPEILQGFAPPNGQAVTLLRGPGKGSAANFLSLITSPETPEGWIALSDQDDVWMPEKLARAIDALGRVPEGRPALFCSRTEHVSPDLTPLGPSRRHRRFGFSNAVVQNVVAGNTIVLNPAAHRLVRSGGAPSVRYHDWWMYLLISGAGGHIHYDPEPTLLYRQHAENELGENRSLSARVKRAGLVGDGSWATWVDANLSALRPLADMLTPRNAARIEQAGQLSKTTPAERVKWLRNLKPWRQSRAETAALYAAILAGRI